MALLAEAMESRAAVLETFFSSSDAVPSWLRSGSATRSGVVVNEDSAMSLTAIGRAIRILSTSMARLPRGVYRRSEEGREPERDHPVSRLLRRPNPEMTAMLYGVAMYRNKLFRGASAAEIEYDRGGRPIALWPLPANQVHPVRVYAGPGGRITLNPLDATPEDRRRGGTLQYDIDGVSDPLPSSKILYVPDFESFDGLVSKSRVVAAAEAVALGIARQEYAASTYAQGGAPGAVIQRPREAPPLSAKGVRQRRAAWEADHQGTARAGRVAILQEGETIETIGWTPEEARVIEAASLNVADIARLFDLPLYLLADMTSANYNNMESEQINFHSFTLAAHIEAEEQELERKLLSEREEADGLYVWANAEAFLRGDRQGRATYYRELWSLGALSADEIRAREEMSSVEGGGETFVPVNYVPLSRAVVAPPEPSPAAPEGSPAPDPPPAAATDRSAALRGRLLTALRPMLEADLSRVVKREVSAVRRELHRLSPGELAAWVTDWYTRDHRPWVEQVMGGSLRACVESIAAATLEEVRVADGVAGPLAQRVASAHSAAFAADLAARHADELRRLLPGDAFPTDARAAVARLLEEWEAELPAEEARRAIAAADRVAHEAIFHAAGRSPVADNPEA